MNAHQHDDRRSFDVLDEVECRYLLRWEAVGRIAFVEGDDVPIVLPVNYVVIDDAIVFRTHPDLANGLQGRLVSFQVDRVDTYRRVGWSVLVRGHAEVVDLERLTDPPPEPWAPGDRAAAVQITPSQITGRRLELVHGAVDSRGYL